MSSVVGLRCDHRVRPPAVDPDQSPRFSWTLQSDRNGVTQRGYRLTVEQPAAIPTLLWDSGPVATDRMAEIEYAGPDLRPGSHYRWTVTVGLDGDDDPPPAADTFDTAPDPQRWTTARWIGLPRPTTLPPERRRATYLVRQLPAGRRRTVVHATAGGVYRLWVNGSAVGAGLLAPGWTDYRHRVPFHTYDVTDLLGPGINVLGVELGDGWYSGFLGPFDSRNFWGETPVFRAVVVGESESGRPELVPTDDTWRAGSGAIVGQDLLHGEFLDLRTENPDWHRRIEATDGWAAATEIDGPAGRLVPAAIDPVRPVATLPAVAVGAPLPGTAIVDFGQNFAGVVRLSVPDGVPGTVVRVRHGEVLNADGTLYTDNLRSAAATDTYVLDGAARDLQPTFTYHGFRYAEVTGLPGELDAGQVAGIALSSVEDIVSEFHCDNELLNDYHRAIRWGLLSNFIETPHDCPNRDERLGWGGDAHVFAPTALRVADVADLLGKWTDDLLDAQSDDGCLADIAPGKVLEFGERGSPGYADAAVFVPWHVYRSQGDRKILQRAYQPARRWLDYIVAMNPDHLWRNGRNNDYGDWLGLEPTDKALVGTAYWAGAAIAVRNMAEALGHAADVAELQLLHGRVAEAFQHEYLDPDGALRTPTQAGCVLALDNDLLTPEQRERVGAHLVDDLERRGHATTGFLAVARLLPTLTDLGRPDLAHRLLLREEVPSWGYQIRRGLTVFAERWNPWDDDGAPTDPWMNSFNHFCLGSFGEWMYTHIGGITPTAPGYRTVRIAPRPAPRVTAAEYRFRSVSGPIGCSWQTTDGELALDVELPPNVAATVSLPDGRDLVVGSGRHHFRSMIEATTASPEKG